MLSHAHQGPGAVILGGSFASVTAARNLAKHGVRVCVLDSETSIARFSRSVSFFAKWPRGLLEDQLGDYLVGVAERLHVQGWLLIPTSDEHVRVVAQNAPRLAKHYVLTTPPLETVALLSDKRLTYAHARNTQVAIPETNVPGDVARLKALDMDFPVVLKPALTSEFLRTTNRKAYRANNRQELDRLYEEMAKIVGPSQVIVQEFLPEPSRNLFSFAGYFRRGEPIAGLSAKRTRQLPTDFGRTSTFVEAVEVPELRQLAAQMLRPIRYTGLAELEFMWNAKSTRFELLDVNARLWAWHSLAIAAGFDLPYMAYAGAVGQSLPCGTLREGVKWVRFSTDVRAAAQEIRAGTLSLGQYLNSLQGSTAFSICSPFDPVPCVVEPFLLLIQRLSKRTPWSRASRTAQTKPGTPCFL